MFRPEEIDAISQEISRKYAPVVAAKSFGLAKGIALSPKELLGISDEISRKFAPKLNSAKPKLVLLPIDPENLYMSWNIGITEPKSGLQEVAEEQAPVVRIYPNQSEGGVMNTPKEWFDVAIDTDKNRGKVCLPKEIQGSAFTAEIGILDKHDHFNVLAASNTVSAPQISDFYDLMDNSRSPDHQNQAYSANQENLPDSLCPVLNRDIH